MYLGCNIIKQQIHLAGGKPANAVIYDMESFLEQCVDKYMKVAGVDTVLKVAHTPFLAQLGASHTRYKQGGEDREPLCEWCGFCGSDPLPETRRAIEDPDAEPGKLAKSAASVLMKCLYAARMCRFDLLRAVQGLARYMTNWTR